MTKSTRCAFLVLISFSCCAQKNIQLASPNGQLLFSFRLVNKSAFYSVQFKKQTLISASDLSLKFDNGDWGASLKLQRPIYRDTSEGYELVVGKTKLVHAHYREVRLPLEEENAPHRKINIVVRAYDDAIAFRYEFPKQKNWTNFVLEEENSVFQLANNPKVNTLFLPNYTSSHEGLYSHLKLSQVEEGKLMDMPTLFEFPENVFMAITEAALLDYAGMYLIKQDGKLVSKLSPLPGQTAKKVVATLPHQSPWRVMMIGDRVGALIESNILTSLSPPNRLKDVSWIKPGKTTFPWWNGNVVPDTLNAPGNNFVTAKYYIDFCARNKIEYHSVVEYGLHQWYVDDGIPFAPGPHSDVTTAVPGLDMKQVCDYAKSQGVGVRVWVHWAALYPKLDRAFEQFEKWGLEGMMVDFMDRDDQEMVNIQTEILEKAAAHHLHIQFHGAYKPTGLSRTYPNEFTREGTLNYEVNKWDPEGLSPNHDIDIPFTRMLAGSTDYHLGGFRAVTRSKFKTQYTRPLMLGTRCHQLAMYVVLENYLQMVCDYPDAYEGQSGFEWIKEIPTVWDEVKVIDARVQEFIVIARRKGTDWYLGAMTNSTERDLTLPLSFLLTENYEATIFRDADDANENPNHLIKEKKVVISHEPIQLHLAAGGGAVIHLVKK